MSSRNKYLSPGERQQALCLRRSLEAAEALVRAGERAVPTLQAAVLAILHGVPGLVIDYVAFMDDETLQPVSRIQRPVLLALAVRIGRTRLIDNTVLVT
jgi:pantoate--beta-alanine ligase